MSLFKLLLVLPIIALATCGLSPVDGTNGSANVLLNNVLVQEPKTRDDFLIAKQIEQRLERTADPRFDLGLDLTTTLETGQIIASGKVNSFTGYFATGTTVATQAAQQDAQKRLMVILADLVIGNLIVTAHLPS